MNLSPIQQKSYWNVNTAVHEKKVEKQNKESGNAVVIKSDVLEISRAGYEQQIDNKKQIDNKQKKENEKLSATSGKDSLEITRSNNESSTVTIHFTDSAQVSRTVDRGYIVINGTRLEISQEMKEQLLQADKEAEEQRVNSFYKWMMEHELGVAKQQGEALKKSAMEAAKAMEIARRIAKGGKVPPEDERKLMEFSPEMYAMAKSAGAMATRHKKYESLYDEEDDGNKDTIEGTKSSLVSYETQMDVSLDDTAEVQGISAAENDFS